MKMSGMFLDPLGYHLLITLVSKQGDNPPSELFYLHRKTTKLKQASKFKGYEITAVGWNFSNTSDTTSGSILLGTSKGLIIETEIGLDTDKIFNTSLEQYWRQVSMNGIFYILLLLYLIFLVLLSSFIIHNFLPSS